MNNTATKLTASEDDALVFVATRGGGLPGGRQNTNVTSRLIRKGMLARVDDVRRVALTDAGRAYMAQQHVDTELA